MVKENRYEEMLEFINPAILSYEEWLKIGQALHYEGEPMTTWQEWSWRDPDRASKTDFQAKWNSFDDSIAQPVTGGTIYQMAKERGWTPNNDVTSWSWNDDVDFSGINLSWYNESYCETIIDAFEFKESDKQDTINFINALDLDDDDYLPYCHAGDYSARTYSRTKGEILEILEKHNLEDVVGNYDTEKGMYICINGFDGKGTKNENVTKYLNALIECDPEKEEFESLTEEEKGIELAKQIAKIKELNLPCRAITYSGGKSIHAIVRIDATNAKEYRQKVEKLFKICEDAGLNPDSANKNPSRYSRMPGVKRGSHYQFLIGTNVGAESWNDWVRWLDNKTLTEELNKLPEIRSLAQIAKDGVGELPEEIISGVLRKGGKLVISARSKAGKSFCVMQLAIAVGSGTKWLGFQCKKGRVLYVDFELSQEFLEYRFFKICKAKDIDMSTLGNVETWSIRGEGLTGDSFANALIGKVKTAKYDMVIIDPLYKVLEGSENDSKDVSKFTRMLDKIAKNLSTAIVYTHHFRKGNLADESPEDRASGSGVFTRDCDAALQLTEMTIKSDQAKDILIAHLWTESAKKYANVDIAPTSAQLAYNDVKDLLSDSQKAEVRKKVDKLNSEVRVFKLDSLLRDFPPIKNHSTVVFCYPLHFVTTINFKAENPVQKKKEANLTNLEKYLAKNPNASWEKAQKDLNPPYGKTTFYQYKQEIEDKK